MVQRYKGVFLTLATVFLLAALSTVWAGVPEAGGPVNINQASVEELAQLEGVGVGYAQRIVQYREENGSFEKPEDIMKVKGVGQKIWEANKDRITTR